MEHNAHDRIDELATELRRLSDRVDRLTQRLDAFGSPSPPPATPQPQGPKPVTPPAGAHGASSKPAGVPRVSPPRVAPKPARPAFDPKAFEWLLGIKGLMLLGVVVVVVGIGMFLKLAYDEGWIAALSPATRCGASALFGMALVVVGELLRKKLSPLASSGFTAAGIATVYAAIYAASRMYGLIGVELAFVLLFMTTLTGVVLGAIAERVMLSLLSLIGAFCVPLLLSTDEPSFIVLPAYLLCLLTIGLVLSGWRGGNYAYARQLAWWGTGIIGSLWLVDMHDRSLTSSLVFVTLAWLMTVVELSVSARFFGTLRGRVRWQAACDAGFIRQPGGELSFNPVSLLSPEARWVNALFGATIWAVSAAGITLRAHDPAVMYASPLVFGLLSVVVVFAAMHIGTRPRPVLTPTSATPVSLLLSALLVNASLLLAATIATAFGGWLEVVSWLAVGLAGVETARRLRFRAVGIFGGAMMLFAVLRLGTFDLLNAMDSSPDAELLGIALTDWSAQMALASVALGVACWRSRYRTERSISGPIAVWLLAASVLHTHSEPGSVGSAWAVLGAAAAWAALRIGAAGLGQVMRINAIVMVSIGSLVALAGQFAGQKPLISPVEMTIVLLGWVAIAALPRAGFMLRTTSAGLALGAGLVALGRIEQVHSVQAMLSAQAALLLAGGLIGGRLRRWSLRELVSLYTLLLVLVWGIDELRSGADVLTYTPLATLDSLAVGLLLAGMLMTGLALRTARSEDEPGVDTDDVRAVFSSAMLGGFWLILLVASTLEVVRAAHATMDSGSAQGAAVSIWWSVYAIASVTLGFRLPRQLRWAGLTLLLIVAGKVLLFDTMTLAPTARVVAAITVGLIIITTGVLYTWLVKRLGEGGDPATNPNAEESTPAT